MADRLSRNFQEPETDINRNDHRLHPACFAALQACYAERFTIDACAGSVNTQLDRFISRVECSPPDARAVAVNVFMYTFPPRDPGGAEFIYCNPPWAIILPLWRHLRLCACKGVLVFPDCPLKPWHGLVLRDAVSVRLLARKGEHDVFLQPSASYLYSVGPLPWDLLAAHFDFTA